MGRWLVLILFLLPSAAAGCWLDIPFRSYHADRDAGYNEQNIGLGVDCRLFRRVDLVGGFYENSNHLESRYFGFDWMALKHDNIELGLREVYLSGYSPHAQWTPYPIPIAKIRDDKGIGVGVMFVPPVWSSKWVMGFWLQLKL